MAAFKRVAIAGATGNLGEPILKQLLASNAFEVTVLTRESSTAVFPSNVTVKKVNYEEPSSLISALQGIEAIVSTLATLSVGTQTKLIDAAIAAGVKRFLPSEFGNDTTNAKSTQLPVFAGKIEVQKYLKEKAAKNEISYTLVLTGPFFDWGLAVGFILDVKNKKGRVFDGGDVKFSASTLETIGKAVVSVFQKPEETKNRALRVKSADVTQNAIIEAAKKIQPGGEWQVEHFSTDEVLKDSYERLGKGDLGSETWIGFLIKSLYGEGYGGYAEKSDNELLGLHTFSQKEIEETIAAVIKG